MQYIVVLGITYLGITYYCDNNSVKIILEVTHFGHLFSNEMILQNKTKLYFKCVIFHCIKRLTHFQNGFINEIAFGNRVVD